MLLFGRSGVLMAFALVVAVYAPRRCFAGEVFFRLRGCRIPITPFANGFAKWSSVYLDISKVYK